jgi:cell wall-associated NlpC family hydrolase
LSAPRIFPCLLVLGFAASVTASIAAQTNNPDDRPRYSVKKTVAVTPKVPDVAPATESATTAAKAPGALALELQFHDQMLAALESHVGASYHFNTTGPNTFDCSGLVWRAFQDIGISFQRGPARSYWATFEAPAKGDEFKFGNMVFFSGLAHVGIVVDEKGFYHSARHGGVMYSPFNDYWLSRIDGFRRVPLNGLQMTAPEKRLVKPTAVIPIADDLNPR